MNYTAKDLETLRLQAQQIQQLLEARRAADLQQYTQQQAALDADKETALRQAYISQQQALAQLPGQLKKAGVNGGAAESSLVRLARAYGNRRSDILAGYNADAASLRAAQAATEAEHLAADTQNRLDYLNAQAAILPARQGVPASVDSPSPEQEAKAAKRRGGSRLAKESYVQLVR